MSEPLKDKAKTLEQWLYGNQCSSLNEVLVRLQDAKKEVEYWKKRFEECRKIRDKVVAEK